jgi:hypothetical protein
MSHKPDASFPKALVTAELEAAYRFFNNVGVKPAGILEPHVCRTLDRMSAEAVTLVVHDSSIISFNSEGYREGLTLSRGEKQQFLLHCSLAVAGDGSRKPHGVLAASYHVPVRTADKLLQDRWADHVRDVHALGLAAASVVHVMDREADDYEVLDLLSGLNGRFVIRVQHNRKLANDGRLRETLGRAQARAERLVPLSRRSAASSGPKQRSIHPAREGRTARLAISSASLVVPRPRTAVHALSEALALNVVRVWEPDPPEGETPVEWLLYTSEPIETIEDILRVVDWYRARWTIEEYFKALKSGCALEKRQLGDLHALTNALALFIPIAWQLLLLKSQARERPAAPACDVLTADELQVLRAAARKPLPDQPTIQDAVLAIAALGGHLKHNGAPGWQTLASGYEKLRLLLAGWNLRHNAEAGTLAPARDQS